MKLYFLDRFDSHLELSNAMVVSLSPAASYALDKRGIKYSIIEDYYNEADLNIKSRYTQYFHEQLQWLDIFDAFLKKNIGPARDNNIPLAKANYLRIVYLVDTIVIFAYILKHFFENAPTLNEIIFVCEDFEGKKFSIFDIRQANRKMFRDLLEIFCKKKGIKLITQAGSKEEVSREGDSMAKMNLRRLFSNEYLKQQAKNLRNIAKYKKIFKIIQKNQSLKGLNILFMHSGSVDIDRPLIEALKHGASVYVEENDNILREDLFLRKVVFSFLSESSSSEGLEQDCKKAAENLKFEKKIVEWIDKECSMDVSSVILPYLEDYISTDCYYLLSKAKKAYRFYKENDIRYVFARGNTDRDSLALLIAGKYMGGARNICTQHASFATDGKVMGVFETETYNFILARDYLAQDYYSNVAKNECGIVCGFAQSSHFLKYIKSKATRKKPKKQNVIYVEKKFVDHARCFNDPSYPLTWYYKFQKEVIEFFASQKNFNFIYKHSDISNQRWAKDSMLLYLKDNRYENISIFSKDFLKALRLADRVIVDYPSGAFFESAVIGKSVLCICPSYFKLQEKAKKIFGKSLQQFSSIKEALSLIDEFLISGPGEYKVEVPFSEDSFIDVFQKDIIAKI